MRRPKSKGRSLRKQRRLQETLEIELLQNWIQFGQPDPGSNPLSLPPLPKGSPLGRIGENAFSAYAGCEFFNQLPISKKTKDGLKGSNYVKMTDIQRASLPHSLCGRDILGAAKTGSGKTLAFVIPVLEKLYKERWGAEDGVGCIIISPTRELANQIFEVLNSVGKYHGFSAGVLIGGRKGVDTEKERVNDLNILVCTPGRLLQHMDETPNFECSQLQVLVLDEADRILDQGFKKEMNAVISQLPKSRQTLLFSATQTKKVQDLARLSLKDPEYLGVHEEAPTATPTGLIQVATIVPLHQKLDTLWSFIKLHLNSRILVFLTTRKQVKFVFEAFRKLRPGIPLMCLHGKMNQEKRLLTYSQFCGNRGVLFTTDVSARGLDFEKAIDWVVQVDCPPDVATYIHRVGRTARYNSGGKSFLILEPSEMKMLEKLKASKIPVIVKKQNKERMLPISPLLAALLVKYPDLQQWAQRAFITYLKSVKKEKDREVFDVMKLPIDEFSASLGLPMTPKVRFLRRKNGDNNISKMSTPQTDDAPPQLDDSPAEDLLESPSREGDKSNEDESDNDLLAQGSSPEPKQDLEVIVPTTRVLKKKKLKINVHRPIGTRVVFDEQGNALPPLATIADTKGNSESSEIDIDKVQERYRKAREMLKQEDKVDKLHASKLRKEKRLKQKMKWKRDRSEDDEQEELSRSDEEAAATRNKNKKSKLYFNGDSDVEEEDKRKGDKINTDSITLPEQEALALKLLSSMHS